MKSHLKWWDLCFLGSMALKSWWGEISSLGNSGLSNHQPYPQLLICALRHPLLHAATTASLAGWGTNQKHRSRWKIAQGKGVREGVFCQISSSISSQIRLHPAAIMGTNSSVEGGQSGWWLFKPVLPPLINTKLLLQIETPPKVPSVRKLSDWFP